MLFVCYLFFICLLLTWIIYPVGIVVLAKLGRNHRLRNNGDKPKISIIIAAYNEEKNITNRIENLLHQKGNYPLEILVGSDGSTDNTVNITQALNYPGVKAFDFKENRGRALVHNDCATRADGEILFFTDAETIFEDDFIEKIAPYFSDPSVGAVSGRIYYVNKDKTSIGHSAGLYWNYEELMRVAESKLGLLTFGTGAALAIRKIAFNRLNATEDIDYAATLEACARGYKVLYEPQASAYDYISETPAGAFKTRIRQTSRCFKSVIQRIFTARILLKHPFIFCAAMLHKVFRHLTPFFMILLFFSNLFLLNAGPHFVVLFFLQIIFYLMALGGYLIDFYNLKLLKSLFSLPYTFLLLNISRGIGVVWAILGKEKATYQTDL